MIINTMGSELPRGSSKSLCWVMSCPDSMSPISPYCLRITSKHNSKMFKGLLFFRLHFPPLPFKMSILVVTGLFNIPSGPTEIIMMLMMFLCSFSVSPSSLKIQLRGSVFYQNVLDFSNQETTPSLLYVLLVQGFLVLGLLVFLLW